MSIGGRGRLSAVRALLTVAVASFTVFALLGASVGTAKKKLPCKHGCDVHLGTYKGKNDQGKDVLVHVGNGELNYGSHKEGAHVINHFKTEFVVTCNGVKSNVYIDSTHRGTINGHRGHIYMGERYMEVLWNPGDITGFVRYRNSSCSGISHFTLHRVH
jgi:hypothetical protein